MHGRFLAEDGYRKLNLSVSNPRDSAFEKYDTAHSEAVWLQNSFAFIKLQITNQRIPIGSVDIRLADNAWHTLTRQAKASLNKHKKISKYTKITSERCPS